MASVSRRGFIAGSAVTAGLMGLAACGNTSTTGGTEATVDLPSADQYPIDPDPEGTEALYTREEIRNGWIRFTNPDGAEIGVADEAKMIQVGGLAFRDANGNGKLDLYEDWRQSDEDRAASLASQLTADEIVPLMFNNGFMSSSTPLDEATLADIAAGNRAGVSRAQAEAESYVGAIKWMNLIQEACEAQPWGIPYLNDTDPYQVLGIPDTCAMALSMDTDLFKRAGMWEGRVFRSTGVRCLLGPQVDLATNPVWVRLGGTISEDPALNRDFARAFAGGLQSTWADDAASDDQGWGTDSVIAMLKHYCGAGASEGGRNDHFAVGAYDVFPGGNFEAHLIPFLDGGLNLDSKTGQMASVMPNYAIAFDEGEAYGENVAGGYSKERTGILRNAGWDGLVCTDWQILHDPDAMGRPWGVENLTPAERWAKGVKAGDDQFGGDFDVELAKEGYALLAQELGEDAALERVRESARRIFTAMNRVDLFDNPYNDNDRAKAILESEEARAFGTEVQQKSVVMLKNKGNVIAKDGISGKPKAYIPQKFDAGSMFASIPAGFSLPIPEEVANASFEIVTDKIGEPTGEPAVFGFPGAEQTVSDEPSYQASDVIRATAEDLEGCEYALFFITNPTDAMNGYVGGDNMMAELTKPYTFLPISLQYRPYTADDARDPSIGGDLNEDGTRENRSFKGASSSATNESDLDLVISTRELLPDAKIILVIEASKPMVFSEIEPYADVILYTLKTDGSIDPSVYGDLITGKVEPTGLLTYQQPASMAVVQAQDEDVPRDMDCYVDSEGNAYDFCFGMNWAGVIDDDRTKTYKANPLTKPETEVVFG